MSHQHDSHNPIRMLAEQLNQALASDDRQSAAAMLVQRSIAYEERGAWQLALDDLNRALALQENLLEAYVFRGLAHNALDHLEQALDDYTHALALHQARGETHPGTALLYCDRGSVYVRLNRLEEGLADVEQSIALDNTQAKTWMYRAAILASQGKEGEALASMEHAVTLEPMNAEYHWLLGFLYRKCGNLFAMHEAYLRATELQFEEKQAAERSKLCQQPKRRLLPIHRWFRPTALLEWFRWIVWRPR